MEILGEHKKKLYLITGGTGFLGWHLIKLVLLFTCILRNIIFFYKIKLIDEGSFIRAMSRNVNTEYERLVSEYVQSRGIREQRFEFFKGSIENFDRVVEACRGVDGVFHLAGIVVHSRMNAEQTFSINFNGTMNVVKAASLYPGLKVVFASTSGVVACSKDREIICDDQSPYRSDIISDWPYYRSKMEAEIQALKYCNENGVPLVVLRPTMMFGPEDFYHRATRTIKSFIEGKIPFIPTGGVSFLDVRDAAVAFSRAMGPRGKPGSCYLITAHNCSCEEFFNMLEKFSGTKKPRFRPPSSLIVFAVSILDNYNRHIKGKWDPTVDPVLAELSKHWWNVDASQIIKDFELTLISPEKTIQDTVKWLKQNSNMEKPKL